MTINTAFVFSLKIILGAIEQLKNAVRLKIFSVNNKIVKNSKNFFISNFTQAFFLVLNEEA